MKKIANIAESLSSEKTQPRLEHLKLLAEIGAFAAALIFFSFKFLSGWSWPSISMNIQTQRQHDLGSAVHDEIVVTPQIECGENGAFKLHDAIAVISYDNVILTNRFVGATRLAFEDRKLIPALPNASDPFPGMGPNQKIHFATHAKVPRQATCVIEVAVLGRRPFDIREAQAHSSAVCLPLMARNDGLQLPQRSKD